MAFLNANSKLIVVFVLVIVVLAMVVGLLLGSGLTLIVLNTKTVVQAPYYGWQAVPAYSGELLDASQYVTSWSTTGASEKILAGASVSLAGFTTACLREYRYSVQVSSDGIVWNAYGGSPYVYPWNQASGILATQKLQFTGPFVGGLKVDLEVHVFDAGCLADKGWANAASDQAYLISGVGKINAPAQAQVGDTISVSTVVGYVKSAITPDKGWKFWGYSLAQKKMVVGPVELTDLQQSFGYTLVSADFSVSSGCSTPNRIEWHLLNELWEKDFSFTTTIDVSAFAPSFSFSGYTGDPVNGGKLTLAFDYASNPTTRFPIVKVVLAYGYGGIGNELILTNGTKTANIPLGQGGDLHFEGYAVDSACRPSPAARLDVHIREPWQPKGTGIKPNWLVFALILILFSAVGVAVAYFAKGIPVWARVLLLVFFLVLGLLLAVVMVPAVLNPGVLAILRG